MIRLRNNRKYKGSHNTEHAVAQRNKKAVLSQRWPRNAPYRAYMGALKIFGPPDNAHGYYSQHFSWACVRIDPVNVPTKFEVRGFTSSWDNRGYPKNLGSPWIRPRFLFSKTSLLKNTMVYHGKKYHGILGRYFLPWYTMVHCTIVESTAPKYHGIFMV